MPKSYVDFILEGGLEDPEKRRELIIWAKKRVLEDTFRRTKLNLSFTPCLAAMNKRIEILSEMEIPEGP
jgi:hypothetical protein